MDKTLEYNQLKEKLVNLGYQRATYSKRSIQCKCEHIIDIRSKR